MQRSKVLSKSDDNSPLWNAHISRRIYEQRKKLAHLFSYPFMETKRNRPTLSKKSWKGNSVDDSGTDKYPYQTEDISRLNHIPEFYIPDV